MHKLASRIERQVLLHHRLEPTAVEGSRHLRPGVVEQVGALVRGRSNGLQCSQVVLRHRDSSDDVFRLRHTRGERLDDRVDLGLDTRDVHRVAAAAVGSAGRLGPGPDGQSVGGDVLEVRQVETPQPAHEILAGEVATRKIGVDRAQKPDEVIGREAAFES